MSKPSKHIILLILLLLLLTVLITYVQKTNSKNTFSIEKFQSEMKAKNYNFEMKDVEESFLPTKRKRMIIGNEALDIYVFSSNKKMENEARCITNDGFGYRNSSKGVDVEWVSIPHFYKKGSIIVQYIGENGRIISDLKDILGEQFAGEK